ncbi:MAG: NusG domain II-containing protein [Clostridiaceae bacterium]|nr:NusG domain II-containing protein [Clostridiaceae bacterium]
MKRNDIILIASVLFIAILSFGLYLAAHSEPGAFVRVVVDGEEQAVLPLNEDTTYEIETDSGVNLLEISDGAARIKEADCPDKLCVHQKKIQKQGESLVCLPHKVIVSVISDEEEDGIDAIAQ